MSEEVLVRYCSPTLAGIKTANLFSCKIDCSKKLVKKIENINKILNPKGVYVYILKLFINRALIYVFRPSKLSEDLNGEKALTLLKENGYKGECLNDFIGCLAGRISANEEFPHEIGLFLGYPLEDVVGFIENKGKNGKCTGCWKVYGDECEARKIFNKFKKCTDVYCKKLNEGLTINHLTVGV